MMCRHHAPQFKEDLMVDFAGTEQNRINLHLRGEPGGGLDRFQESRHTASLVQPWPHAARHADGYWKK
jgi:hypothetical protein